MEIRQEIKSSPAQREFQKTSNDLFILYTAHDKRNSYPIIEFFLFEVLAMLGKHVYNENKMYHSVMELNPGHQHGMSGSLPLHYCIAPIVIQFPHLEPFP